MKSFYEKEGKKLTNVGILPYRDVNRAVCYSLKHEIPFFPELPRNGDTLKDYIAGKKPSCLKRFKQNKYSTVKIQAFGPVTLMQMGYSKEKAKYEIKKHLINILEGLDAKEVILFLNELSLKKVNSSCEKMWHSIFKEFNTINGVYVLNLKCIDDLLKTEIDIVGFDSKEGITCYKERNGKRIAWGAESEKEIFDWRKGDLLMLPFSSKFKTKCCIKKLEELLKVSKTLQ